MKEDGVTRITAERRRQLGVKGYSAGHDDDHGDGLAMAAVCYAACVAGERIYVMEGNQGDGVISFVDPWPWDTSSDKRSWVDGGVESPTPGSKKAIRMLEKAGALIAAEIDRQLRMRESDEP
jgi:hypothetical protein